METSNSDWDPLDGDIEKSESEEVAEEESELEREDLEAEDDTLSEDEEWGNGEGIQASDEEESKNEEVEEELENGKQIILSADSPPGKIPSLEARLISR